MRILVITLSIFVLSAGTAFAEQGKPTSAALWHGPAVAAAPRIGTTTHGTSSPERGPEKPEMQQAGLPGMIASLGTNSFMMTLPGNREHATTTFTVNVTASTTYQRASSTATFADLTVGGKVVVMGKVATSTKSITAQRVVITSAEITPPKHEGLFQRLKHFLFGRHGGDDGTESGRTASSTAAAAVGTSGLASFLQSLFSWL